MKKAKAKIHQLTDMDIREVSLVDHAANKRRFLIAKRSEHLQEEDETVTGGPPHESERAGASR
jgi:hypothetical protein